MENQVTRVSNKSLAALMKLAIGEQVTLPEEETNSLWIAYRLIERIKSPGGLEWILTFQGQTVVKAMLAVGKVLTQQDDILGQINVKLST
jgi:hypothetical protein